MESNFRVSNPNRVDSEGHAFFTHIQHQKSRQNVDGFFLENCNLTEKLIISDVTCSVELST